MHVALREMTQLGRWRREFAVLLAIGAILGWLGAYGTHGCLGLPDTHKQSSFFSLANHTPPG
jgi:hypothetical protein